MAYELNKECVCDAIRKHEAWYFRKTQQKHRAQTHVMKQAPEQQARARNELFKAAN